MSPMSIASSMEATELSPFVYWSQTKSTLLLKVDLKDAKVTLFPMPQVKNQ